MKNNPVPFDNRSFTLGDLTVESAEDVISVYGSLDIRRDQTGLTSARALSDYFTSLVAELERQNSKELLTSSESLELPIQRSNPFG